MNEMYTNEISSNIDVRNQNNRRKTKRNSRDNIKSKSNRRLDKRKIAIIVSIIVIILAIFMYLNLKASEKPEAILKSFIKEYKNNPEYVMDKYSKTSFEREIEKEESKYIEYKVIKVDKTTDENMFKVETEISNVDKNEVEKNVLDTLKKNGINPNSENYYSQYLQEYRKENKKSAKNKKKRITTFTVKKDTLTNKFIVVNAREIKN